MFWKKSPSSSQREYGGKTFKSAVVTVHAKLGKIEIVGQYEIKSAAFLDDGKHIVSGGAEGKIRRWRTEDGKGVENPIDVKSEVNTIAVSRDRKWIVSGTDSGELAVWDAKSHERVTGWKTHSGAVCAVDVSLDETAIVTGSSDKTACVWSLSTGQRLLGPLKHKDAVVAAKYSPDGRFIATATWHGSVWVYESLSGRLLVNVPISVNSWFNQSLVWVRNSENLFALSFTGEINYLNVLTGTTLCSWSTSAVQWSNSPSTCIALASNGTFIATSTGSSVSFWDTTTHKQIGPVIKHTSLESMAISANYDLLVSGGREIALWNIHDVLPSSYLENVSALA